MLDWRGQAGQLGGPALLRVDSPIRPAAAGGPTAGPSGFSSISAQLRCCAAPSDHRSDGSRVWRDATGARRGQFRREQRERHWARAAPGGFINPPSRRRRPYRRPVRIQQHLTPASLLRSAVGSRIRREQGVASSDGSKACPDSRGRGCGRVLRGSWEGIGPSLLRADSSIRPAAAGGPATRCRIQQHLSPASLLRSAVGSRIRREQGVVGSDGRRMWRGPTGALSGWIQFDLTTRSNCV